MRMRQSIAEIEDAFFEEIEEDRERRERLRRRAEQRQLRRHHERAHRHGSMRFLLLVLVLLGTAGGGTVAMFQTLYFLLGCARGAALFALRRLSASSTSARALAPAATFSCWIS